MGERTVRVVRGLVCALLLAPLTMAEARAESYTGSVLVGVDYAGANPLGGVTGTAFQAACRTDRAAGGAVGTPAINAFLQSAANGVDGRVYDLGTERFFSATAAGPGATTVGPLPPAQVTSYDLDLFFLTAIAPNGTATNTGCIDANAGVTSASSCYGRHTTPDESACVVGWTDPNTGIKHGARYVMVSAALNATGAPLPFLLSLS